MARIVAYTRKAPTEIGVEADLYTDVVDGSQTIIIRTFEGVTQGIRVPLDANQADLLGTNLLELAAQLRGGS